MKKDKKKRDTKEEVTVKDLPATEPETVSGGTVSNIMKTKHDTAKNSISNVR